MKRTFLLCMLLLGLPAPAFAKLKVVASFSIIADIAQHVAGDDATVETLVQAGGDVHVYEPTPRDARTIAAANVIFVNGLGFEGWMDRLIQSADAKGRVVKVSRGVTPITVNKNETDPHAWQDVSNGMIYVDTIRDTLAQADPDHAEHYRANADRYLKELVALDIWVRKKMDELPESDRRAITSHDALRYFARAYHFDFISAHGLSTEGEISARNMADIVDQIRAQHIKAVFLENMTNPDLIEQLAEDSGVTVGGTLYSDSLSDKTGNGNTYISMFYHNVNTIVAALRK